MTTQNERLAVVETELKGIRLDVTDIKADVKTLLFRDASRSGGDNRLRSILPFAAFGISLIALALGVGGG